MKTPELSAVGLSRSFNGVEVVSDVSFDLSAGECVVLIGPNGAGKTTIFNLLAGAIRAGSGGVFIRGEDVTGASCEARARMGLGRTFQDVRLFDSMTVQENVQVHAYERRAASVSRTLLRPRSTMTDARHAKQVALQCLERVNAAHLATLDVAQLSYAQTKLVSIARVMAARPSIVLLDEPASGVDEDGRDQLCQVVKMLAADGIAVCVVEHNLDVVRQLADRLVFLAEGRVLAAGDPQEIFSASHLADVYFGSGVVE